MFLDAFTSMPRDLKALGVEVINCSRTTALTVFPRVPIEQAVPMAVSA
jgi:hypothetical protein